MLQKNTKSKKNKSANGKRRRMQPKTNMKELNYQTSAYGSQLGLRNPRDMGINLRPIMDYWRTDQVFETDLIGNLSVFIKLRNPLLGPNGLGSYPRAQALASLYDEYKVISVGVIIDFLFINPQVGDGVIAVDYDSVPSGSYTYADLRDNQHARFISGTNQAAFQVPVYDLTGGTFANTPCIIHRGGYYDFQTPPDEGAILIALERYPASTKLVRITVNALVKCRRRRTIPTAKERELRALVDKEKRKSLS